MKEGAREGDRSRGARRADGGDWRESARGGNAAYLASTVEPARPTVTPTDAMGVSSVRHGAGDARWMGEAPSNLGARGDSVDREP